jgi:hypothetical protein
VVRGRSGDRLGYLEDQFFSTVFFGSGLPFLAMTFAAAALAGVSWLSMPSKQAS